jgi:hypothetical protein
MTNTSHTLYAIHSDGEHVQYAGHIILWNTSEETAKTIAEAMLIAPIVGVEISYSAGFGQEDTPVAWRGLSFTEAQEAVEANKEEAPVAPYAVYSGLPGYLPNHCDHFRTLRDALEHFAEELDKAIDDLAIPDEDDHELRAFMLADLEVVRTALRANGEPIHPEHNLKFGYSSHITTYEWLTCAPIAPKDYNASITND